jgi:hypothetical protein
MSCHYISGTGTFELQVVSCDLDTLQPLRARGADQFAQREGHAHQLFVGRGES